MTSVDARLLSHLRMIPMPCFNLKSSNNLSRLLEKAFYDEIIDFPSLIALFRVLAISRRLILTIFIHSCTKSFVIAAKNIAASMPKKLLMPYLPCQEGEKKCCWQGKIKKNCLNCEKVLIIILLNRTLKEKNCTENVKISQTHHVQHLLLSCE